MADYVNSNILCQAYFHVEVSEQNDVDVDFLSQQLNKFVSSRGKFFLYEDIEVDITFESGSLIGYITIGGTIYGIYKFIQEYPTFRQGVLVLYNDVKRLSESFVNEGLFLSRARSNSIIHTEARVGVIGSIKSINDGFDYIRVNNGEKESSSIANKIEDLYKKSVRLLDNLVTEEDKRLVCEEFLGKLNELPEKVLLSRDEREKPVPQQTYAKRLANTKFNAYKKQLADLYTSHTKQ